MRTRSQTLASRRGVRVVAVVAIVGVCVMAFLYIHFWPFTKAAVIDALQQVSDSKVQMQGFRQTYFPPGCVLSDVVFLHGNVQTPLITIKTLTMKASYLSMLAQHLSSLEAEGMHIVVPPFGSGQPLKIQRSSTSVGEIVANGTVLEFASDDSRTPALRFDIHKADLQNVGWNGPLDYRIELHNPKPPGEIVSTGKFGVWNQDNPGETPLSGNYEFQNADLSVFDGIAGTLSSVGKFSGLLDHINVSGTTATPNFEVTYGGNPAPLNTQFTAHVDGTNGDTFLEHVDAQLRKTHILAEGSIAAANAQGNEGKVAVMNFTSRNGRVEDMLELFIRASHSPMTGVISLQAKVTLPGGDEPFLRRLKLNGGFGLGGGEFSKPSTQEDLNKLSAGARGEKNSVDPETVVADLAGQASVANGTATFPGLSFNVPGASAKAHGTYNLISHRIDMHGQMQVDSKISKTTSGTTSFLLKMMDPIFKKKKKGEIVPVKVSGTYEKPSFALDLMDRDGQKSPSR